MQHKLESEYSLLAWCKSGTRTHGPGESPQSLKVEAGTPVKFKSGTPGPTSKFKRRTLV